MLKIYISGKITGTDDYMERFAAAEERLTKQGYIVYNPAKINAQMPIETTYDGYMSMSKTILEQTDCIYLLSGWELSGGSNLEFQWALNRGMMFMFEDAEYIKRSMLLMNAAEQNSSKYAYSLAKS